MTYIRICPNINITVFEGFDAYPNGPGRHIANVLFILKLGHCLTTQRITMRYMVISKPKSSAGFKGKKKWGFSAPSTPPPSHLHPPHPPPEGQTVLPPPQSGLGGQGDLHTLHTSHPRLPGPRLLTLNTLTIFTCFSFHLFTLVQATKAHGSHCPELINPEFFFKI